MSTSHAPAGWQLVPTEPTEEMQAAGADAFVFTPGPKGEPVPTPNAVWGAMLAAARKARAAPAPIVEALCEAERALANAATVINPHVWSSVKAQCKEALAHVRAALRADEGAQKHISDEGARTIEEAEQNITDEEAALSIANSTGRRPQPTEAELTAIRAGEGADEILRKLRSDGWRVAAHNDYILKGLLHTFWLFTRGDRAVKGEATNDYDALSIALEAALSARPARMPTRELRIVCDGPPGPEAGRFVECEDQHGKSFKAGEWFERSDGLWELRVDLALIAGERT